MKNLHVHSREVILGMILLIFSISGCSSQLQTRIVSKGMPPKPEVVQLEEPMRVPDSVLKEPKIAGIETEIEGVRPSDIPIESPPQPAIRENHPQSIFANTGEEPIAKLTPLESGPDDFQAEESGGQPSMVSEAPIPERIDELPFFVFEPESPPLPTKRETVPSLVESGESSDRPEFKEEPMPQQQPMEVAKLTPSETEVPRISGEEELRKTLVDVYFDYDRFGLREEDFPELSANAELLVSQLAGRKIVLEGHCDERGTESYNMILGKRRARTVHDFLVDLGVPKETLNVMSYGKEKPFCTEQTVDCWQENRRVHFEVQ